MLDAQGVWIKWAKSRRNKHLEDVWSCADKKDGCPMPPDEPVVFRIIPLL
jgi:hypothetical protein